MARLKNQTKKSQSKKRQAEEHQESSTSKRKKAAPGNQYKYPQFFGTSAHISNRVRLVSGTVIYEKLTPAQRLLFKKTCFGDYMNRHLPHFCQQLVHFVLHREVKDEFKPTGTPKESMCFDIRGEVLTFGLKEFGILTGLPFARTGNNILKEVAKRKKELKKEDRGRFFKKYLLSLLVMESKGEFRVEKKKIGKKGEVSEDEDEEEKKQNKGKKAGKNKEGKISQLTHRHIEEQFTYLDWQNEEN